MTKDRPIARFRGESSMPSFLVHSVESISIVELPERIDSDSSLEFDKTLKDLTGSGKLIIICDFSKNTYISSLCLRVLLSTLKGLKKSGGTLAICSLSPFVQEVFDISGFSRIFSLYPNEEEAITDLKKTRDSELRSTTENST